MLANLFISTLSFGFIIFSLRVAWWRKNIDNAYPRVLMYHMVCEHLPKKASKFNRLRVTPKAFEKQLAWLKNNGFSSYTLSELVALEDIPQKTVVITFDDGYRDNLINALPLLKKYSFKATIYLVVERFNQDWATDKDLNQASDELNQEAMLSNEEVKELLDSGLIEIGAHTLNHANLPMLSYEEKQHQIITSKQHLEQAFHIDCQSFAYPFGFFDEDTVELVKQAGYTNATTTQVSIYNKKLFSKYEIPRIMVSGRQNQWAFILKMKKGRNR